MSAKLIAAEVNALNAECFGDTGGVGIPDTKRGNEARTGKKFA
jgi:hypothetical protein